MDMTHKERRTAPIPQRAVPQDVGLVAWKRTRWPYLLGLIPVAVVAATTIAAPSPAGHWAEHLSSAALDWAGMVVLLTSAWLARRHLGWPILFAPVVAGGLLVAGWGDLTVARSIWRIAGENTPSYLASDPAAYLRGHELDELGGMIMLAAGFLFVVAVGLTRRVKGSAALLAGVLALAPPWMIGGFGAWWITARAHSEALRAEPESHERD